MADRFVCRSEERREAVREARNASGDPFLNGFDFLEVSAADQAILTVRFLHDLPGTTAQPVPASPAPALTIDHFLLSGGVRITGLNILSVAAAAGRNDELRIAVDRPGDFSPYTISLVTSAADANVPAGFDPQLSSLDFSFKINCPNPFDCKPLHECPPAPALEPDINYLAKDYATFRTTMLDRLALLAPAWTERSPADLGVTLVETLAYVADFISYRQDAVATEAYLGTARLRTSAKRHARLVDYRMHEGCNARAWVQVVVRNDITRALGTDPARLPAHTQLLTTIAGEAAVIAPGSHTISQAVANGKVVFETMLDLPDLYLRHNQMPFYNWSSGHCCLPRGATRATLRGHLPDLKAGDVLVFREIVGPLTDDPADADPKKRCTVRLTSVVSRDPLNNSLLDPLTLEAITEIGWGDGDALPFPLCVSSRTDAEHGGRIILSVSAALGNITLADSGRRIGPPVEDSPIDFIGVAGIKLVPRFRPRLANGPLTFAARAPFADSTTLQAASTAFGWTVSDARPALTLESTDGPDVFDWLFSPDMLFNGPADRVFTVEAEADGSTFVRFGDGPQGVRPAPGSSFAASYRVGNGTAGTVAAEALTHIVTTLPDIDRVWNPLPARGGVEPESIAHVRQSAPWAFRTQERAVTTQDYADVAMRFPGVRRAAATLRWTGSWSTVFLTVEREGGAPLDAVFKSGLTRFMERNRMAGQDLEIERVRLVPLQIGMRVCLRPDYFQSDVRLALLEVFSNATRPDGQPGVFAPDNLNLGDTFYLSRLYAAAQDVDGVLSVRIDQFQRQNYPGGEGIALGQLTPGRLEAFVLANDPNFPERGTFTLDVDGGR